MAFNVTPTSGDSPYLLTASFIDQYLINGMDYFLRILTATSVGECPLVGTASTPPAWADSLLANGSYNVVTSVPIGSCRIYTLQIVAVSSDTVVDEMFVHIDNV